MLGPKEDRILGLAAQTLAGQGEHRAAEFLASVTSATFNGALSEVKLVVPAEKAGIWVKYRIQDQVRMALQMVWTDRRRVHFTLEVTVDPTGYTEDWRNRLQ